MTNILTNTIESNSFMGLITDAPKNNFRQILKNRIFVQVESKEILRNLAIATAIIVIGLASGSIGQQKAAYVQNITSTTIANV